MKKTVQAFAAAAAICASLAFSAIGVARAAAGFVSETLPGRVVTIYLQAQATSTPRPSLPGQEESGTIGSQASHEAEPTEMDDDHSQGSSFFEQDDNEEMSGMSQPGMTQHHESESGGSMQNSGDDGDGD